MIQRDHERPFTRVLRWLILAFSALALIFLMSTHAGVEPFTAVAWMAFTAGIVAVLFLWYAVETWRDFQREVDS